MASYPQDNHRPALGGGKAKGGLSGRTIAIGASAATPEQSDTARKYSEPELREAKRRIEFMFIHHGYNARVIQERLLRGEPSFNLSKAFITRVIEETKVELSNDAEEQRASWKMTAIRRCYANINLAREQKDLAALAKFEAQLADLQGSRDPLRVETTVMQTKAMAIVFANADDASLLRELQEALAEERTIKQLRASTEVIGHVVTSDVIAAE